jgi:hypothetical protein
MQTTNASISEFNEMQVPQDKISLKRDQYTAFTESNNALIKKLKDLGQKIQDKQKMYADLANA